MNGLTQDEINEMMGVATDDKDVIVDDKDIIVDDKDVIVDEKDIIVDDKDVVVDDNAISIHDKFASELGYENFESLQNSGIKENLSKIKSFEESNKSLKEENEFLYSQFKDVKSPFVNDRVAMINELLKKDDTLDYSLASTIIDKDFSEVSDKDILLIEAKLGNSEDQLSDAQLKRVISKRFSIDSWDDFDKLDEDEKLDLEINAKKALRTIEKKKELIKDFSTEDFVPTEIKTKLEEQKKSRDNGIEKITETWSPLADQVKESFNEFPIFMTDKEGKNGEEPYIKFTLDEKEKEKYSNQVLEFAKNYGLTEITEDNQKALNVEIYRSFLADNIGKITRIVADRANNEAVKKYQIERDNPDKGNNDKSDKTNSGKDFNREQISKMSQRERM